MEIARGDSVGEGEEGGCIAARWPQPFQVEPVLIIQHALQPFARHVALGTAIDGVAHRHVVSRHRLRYGARRAAHLKEPARHFLPRANLGEGPVAGRVQVDFERFLMRAEYWIVVAFHDRDLIGRSPQEA